MSSIGTSRRPSRTAIMNSQDSFKRNNNESTPLLDSVQYLTESMVNKNSQPELQTGVSWGVAAFLLVNTALGAGMLNYPYAFNQIGGLTVAILMQSVLLIFITSTMFILVYCADFNQDDTYHDVLLSMCGKRAQQMSALTILLTCYGINITFLVIIGDQYDRMFNSLMPNYVEQYWFLDRKFTIFATAIVFIWPMCYARRLDFLRHASILGMFAMLYVAFLTVYEHYMLDDTTLAKLLNKATTAELSKPHQVSAASINLTTTHISGGANNLTTSQNAGDLVRTSSKWLDPMTVVPVLCFAYQTHEVIVPVYACMKQRCIGQFMKASIFCLVILFLLYNAVGAYGYLTFGEDVGPDIISLYDAKDPIVIIGILALVIKFITTYPPLMFCGRGALDGLYGEMRKLSPDELKSTESTRRFVITTLWFYSTVALAAFAPDISVTLQLLGSMASINVFVFPGMCLVSLTRRLRRARLLLLIYETSTATPNNAISHQRAKDYHLISGSYYSSLKRQAATASSRENLANLEQNGFSCANGTNPCLCQPPTPPRQQFTATFASLIEFENNASSNSYRQLDEHSSINGDSNGGALKKIPTYGTNQPAPRHHKRHSDDFESLFTNGSIHSSSQDHCNHISSRNNIYNSYEGYGDNCNDMRNTTSSSAALRNHDMINPAANNCNGLLNGNVYKRSNDYGFDMSSTNKDMFADLSTRLTATPNGAIQHQHHDNHHNHHRYHSLLQHNQFSQNSWNNRSTTGSILDRVGSTIAPSVVSQTGISRCTAIGLYLFSAILIIFGMFIFILELVNVSGFI